LLPTLTNGAQLYNQELADFPQRSSSIILESPENGALFMPYLQRYFW
jgi:hypothetical protein